MAHFNGTDANRHSASTSGGKNFRLYRPPAFEYSSVDIPEASTYSGGTYGQRYPTSALRSTLRPEESPQPASPGTPNPNGARTQGDTQIVSSKRFWSVVGPCEKPRSSGVPIQETPPDSAAASEDLITTPTRRDYECGPPPITLIWKAPILHKPASPNKIRTPRRRRYFPYQRTSTEAGSLSEATVGAEQNSTTTEEITTTPTRSPASGRKPHSASEEHRESLKELCKWAEKWKGLKSCPSQRQALTIALEAVQLLHPTPVYAEPRLMRSMPHQGQRPRTQAAEAEARRREKIRKVNEELTKYYELPEDWTEWGCLEILLRVLQDLRNL